MKILIEMTHPAHVHFFRHAIAEFQKRGHTVAVTAREKDVTIQLLDNYGIPFTRLSKVGGGKISLLSEMLVRDTRLLRFCRRFKPDILTAISGVYAAHAGWLLRKPVVVWDDTEAATAAHKITYPFVSAIYSPDCFQASLGEKHHLYAGLHELAYLHPNRFVPDSKVVKDLGIEPTQKYCLIRFVSWQAHHDAFQHGIATRDRLRFVEEVARYAKPYVTCEGLLPVELERYRLNIPAHQIHHVMAFAALYVGEGATMATESGLLGVPAVYVSTLRAGTIDMLTGCGLVRQTADTDEALQFCIDWLSDPAAKQKCTDACRKLLANKIDVTEYIVKTIESYLGSGTQ